MLYYYLYFYGVFPPLNQWCKMVGTQSIPSIFEYFVINVYYVAYACIATQ